MRYDEEGRTHFDVFGICFKLMLASEAVMVHFQIPRINIKACFSLFAMYLQDTS